MPGPHSGPREIDCLNSGGQKQNYLKFSDISSISHFQSPVNHRYLIMIESSCLSWRAIGIYEKIKTNNFWNFIFWQFWQKQEFTNLRQFSITKVPRIFTRMALGLLGSYLSSSSEDEEDEEAVQREEPKLPLPNPLLSNPFGTSSTSSRPVPSYALEVHVRIPFFDPR